MANKIEYVEDMVPQRDGLAAAMSRYANAEVIYYGDLKRLTYTTYKKTPISPSKDDRYGLIPPGYEYRPDKASVSAYGIPDLWWKILEANNMKDIFDFKAGLTIKIPADVY